VRVERGVEESVRRVDMCWSGLRTPWGSNYIKGYTSSSIPLKEAKMGIIGWIVFGLIVGAIAKLVMPGRDPGGWIVTILLGIAGALLGGFLGRAVGWYGPNDAAGFLMSLLGAIVLLALYRFTLRRHA
jgi:uncharacterized membrane protein YeaQ/YmgE (transglycosylase-associated protein family)